LGDPFLEGITPCGAPRISKIPEGSIWVFPKIEVPQNGWLLMENPINMDDLGGKPTIFGNTHIKEWKIAFKFPVRI